MGIHDGHRKRMLESFLKNGADGMHPHEMLEVLLFYAIPRQNTNTIAHELIRSFGSLRGVFDAPYEELIKVRGVGESSAVLIKMVPEMARAYLSDMAGDVIISSNRDAAKYLLPRFVGRTNETVFVMCLDNKNRMISCVKVNEGTVNAATISSRSVIQIGMHYNAAALVLAHNHPGGTALPSAEDINTTRHLADLCANLKMPLLDHLVVSDGDYVSMAETGILKKE